MKKAVTFKAIFTPIFILAFLYSNAQANNGKAAKPDSTISESINNHAIFYEIGGPGLAQSLNYDTRLGSNRNGWGIRIGAGYFGRGGNSVLTVPFQFNYLFGTGSNFFEIGEGTTYLNAKGYTRDTFFQFDNVNGFIGTATLGYRYQPQRNRFNFRIAFVPIFYDEGVIPGGGISVGYSF